MYSGPSRAPALARSESLTVGTPQQFRWLNGIVKGILWLNLLDAVFTLLWVRTGMAVEANALLRDLAHENAIAFVLAKLGLVSLGSLFLWRYRRHPLAVVAIFGAFLVYYLILLHHLQYSSHFLRQVIGL
ncbi:MAG: hypothetical protein AMS21_06655 [Gemmatimonas sp. SG8_38_2]|nr:MAG: hypothetical protein AMS21_06655 [Gemmatimonas sp. SG8_38_2]